ncbi:hypothetical protein FRC04_001433 [Tulasnella sp. 424]|nr:hypothetical protein FRC04_001433 [Tulasnella sp. 424]KAG8972708.1 hypothetical protein FRC05_009629 [Tulasnella sp. 425]
MPVGIDSWIADVPPITRWWGLSACAISIAVQCHLVAPLQLYFSYKSALVNFQPWRAVTTFLYFGPLNLDFVFHLFFFMRYSRMLEESSFANRKADFLWLLILSAMMLLVISPLVTLPFLSAPLAFVPIYLWSRSHPATQLSLFGLINITAPYLPLALVGFSYLINGSYSAAAGDLVGCVVGHVAWYLHDVWPREAMGGPTWASKAPDSLRRMLGDD